MYLVYSDGGGADSVISGMKDIKKPRTNARLNKNLTIFIQILPTINKISERGLFF